MSSPDSSNAHPYAKAHLQLIVTLFARAFAANGSFFPPPTIDPTAALVYYTLSTAFCEGVSFWARGSPALVEDFGPGPILPSMGLAVVWIIATAVNINSKAGMIWSVLTHFHEDGQRKPLVNVFVSLGFWNPSST